jgi:superfamily II DNA or RNA helicase
MGEGDEMTLRPQQETFEKVIADAYRRVRRVLGVAPTGFGKGFVIADMAMKSAAKGRNVLVVTNRRVIVYQIQRECQSAGLRAGIIMGSEEPDKEASVQVASIQTLKRRDFYGLPDVGFCIIDEAHQEPAAYTKMIEGRLAKVPVLGLTATPVGPGGSRLCHFQETVEPIKNTEVIAAGDLLPVKYLAPFEPDMEGINLKSASRDEVGERVELCEIYTNVFKEWEPYQDQQTLAILPSVATANTFLSQCLSRGIPAKLIDGSTVQDEREEAFREFADESTRMLVSVDVLREGFNAPNARVLLMLQPTHQFRVHWQALGRVKRPHPGQTEAVVIDCAGNLWRHLVHPDQDPPWEEVTNDTTIEDVIAKKSGTKCPNCGSKDIYSIGKRYKCEDCKHEWEGKKPFVCPHCKQGLGPHQRVIGGKCPNCGEKVSGRPMKRIKYADGSLREVPANEIKRRKKCKANAEQATWDQCRYIALNSGRTLDFARVIYRQKLGKWPPSGLKNCPDSANSADWKRMVSDVYPWMKQRGKKQ